MAADPLTMASRDRAIGQSFRTFVSLERSSSRQAPDAKPLRLLAVHEEGIPDRQGEPRLRRGTSQ